MAYLYGDSTESPLEINYIEFLRDALDFSVEVLVSDHRVQALEQSGEEKKRAVEAELAQLRALHERVNQLLEQPFGPAQSSAQRCAGMIRQGADESIKRIATQIKQSLSDQLGQMTTQIQREHGSNLRALEILLRHRDLPDSSSHVEVVLEAGRGGYAAQVRGRADIGLEWVQTLEIPSTHLFGQLLKVERLSPNLEIRVPEKGGWMRKGMRVRTQRISGKYVTEVVHTPHQTTIKLRATPQEDESGYNLLVAATDSPVRLVSVQQGGEHSPPFEPLDEDVRPFLELAQALTEAADDLSRHRGPLRDARIDGKAIADCENPSILVTRLIAKAAPVVQEIARHSLTPDELVLKRFVTDDRREEIFVAKTDLLSKLDPVPVALRGVFAPLGLGDLGRPGIVSRAGGLDSDGNGGRHGRMETHDPVTEIKEVPLATGSVPPARTLINPAPPSGRSGRSESTSQAPPSRSGSASHAPPSGRPTISYPPPPAGGPNVSFDGGVPGHRPLDDDDVTIVAAAREKSRPIKQSEDSIDVALSELEQES